MVNYVIQSDANSIGAAANDSNGTDLRTVVDRLTQDFTVLKAAVGFDTVDGLYFGGTTAANLLKDYEEGTFTPSFADDSLSSGEGQTASVALGRYIKIGRMCHFQIGLKSSSFGSLTTTQIANVIGLPFISVNDANRRAVIRITGFTLNLTTAGTTVSGRVRENATHIQITIDDAVTGSSFMTLDEISSVGEFLITGAYETAT